MTPQRLAELRARYTAPSEAAAIVKELADAYEEAERRARAPELLRAATRIEVGHVLCHGSRESCPICEEP